jgi:hypothetical protein
MRFSAVYLGTHDGLGIELSIRLLYLSFRCVDLDAFKYTSEGSEEFRQK